jgi:hypothetical protein
MAAVAGAQTCPACGSGAVSSQRRTRDPKTGKSTTPSLIAIVVWGLLALCGVILLLLVSIQLIQLIEAGLDIKVGALDVFVIFCCISVIANFVVWSAGCFSDW